MNKSTTPKQKHCALRRCTVLVTPPKKFCGTPHYRRSGAVKSWLRPFEFGRKNP